MAIQTFVASTVLTAAQMNALQANDYNQTVSTKTASYTLVAADKGTRVVMNSASATTITVNTSLFSAGDTLVLQNISTGVCTMTAGTATVSSAGSLAIPQNGSGILYFTSASVSIFYPSAATSASGLTFITGTTFTTATSVSLPTNTFTSTYQYYKIFFTITAVTADADFTMRLRASGTDNTVAEYDNTFLGLAADGTTNNVTTAGQTAWNVGENDAATVRYNLAFDVICPQISAPTFVYGTYNFQKKDNTNQFIRFGGAGFRSSTVFDSLTFISSVASSITGNYKVFGYANS